MPREKHYLPYAPCDVCDDLLGTLEDGETVHAFCSWATPADWAALRPFFSGHLSGIESSGV